MHPVEEYQDITTLTVDGLNECEIVTLAGRTVDVKLLYNPGEDRKSAVGDQMSWRQDAVEKASTQQSGPSGPRLSSCSWRENVGLRKMSLRGCALGPRLSSPGERERNAVVAIRVGVNMLQFCSVFNPLSHTTLSNKVRGIFF